MPRVLFHELQYPGDSRVRGEVRAMITAYRRRLMQLFAHAKAARELPADLDAALASMLFMGAVQGLIDASIAGDEAAMTKRARQVLALLLHGYKGRSKR